MPTVAEDSERFGMVMLIALLMGTGAIVAGFMLSLWWAWWLYPTWVWLIVPLGAPHISFIHFWGFSILFRLRIPELTSKSARFEASDYFAWAVVSTAAAPIFYLFLYLLVSLK